MGSRAERALWGGVAALVVLCLVAVSHRALISPGGRVVLQDRAAPWIMPGTPVATGIQQWERESAPVGRYQRVFELAAPPAEATLWLRSLGEARARLNDRDVVIAESAASWRRFSRAEVGSLLRAGSNTLVVEVANRHGPPLLSLRLQAGDTSLASGPEWRASFDGGPERTVLLATDQRVHPASLASERPLVSLWQQRNAIAALLVFSVLAFLAARRWVAATWLPAAAAALVAAAWLALFVLKLRQLGLLVGFDAQEHLVYLEGLRNGEGIPLATDHFGAYHPPLFYLASLLLYGVSEALGASPQLALKAIPFLSGLALVAAAAVLTRRLAPGEPVACALAILFAGFLPVNLYTAAYFSNEGLHAALAGWGLVLGAGLLLREPLRPRALALLSLVLGAALLTKATALVIAGPVLGALALAIGLRAGARPRDAGKALAALMLPALAVAGWFYARNVIVYGTPLLLNWDLPDPRLTWWSPPGFHTPEYYLRFGESLVRPFYAGFVSFWDALYSTLWGDGFLAGRSGVSFRHDAWNYDFMAAGYALALPATALLLAGLGLALGSAWRDGSPARRAAHGLVLFTAVGMLFAAFWVTLSVAYHTQVRASYLVALTPVLAFGFARGASALDAWLVAREATAGRALLAAWLGALFGVFYLGFAG